MQCMTIPLKDIWTCRVYMYYIYIYTIYIYFSSIYLFLMQEKYKRLASIVFGVVH